MFVHLNFDFYLFKSQNLGVHVHQPQAILRLKIIGRKKCKRSRLSHTFTCFSQTTIPEQKERLLEDYGSFTM